MNGKRGKSMQNPKTYNKKVVLEELLKLKRGNSK